MLIFVLFLIAIGILLLSEPGKKLIYFFLNLAIAGFVFVVIGVILGLIIYFVKDHVSKIMTYGGLFLTLGLISVGILKIAEKNGKSASDIIGMNKKLKE